MAEVECVVKSGDQLGEGPCWSAAEQRLYWFDIKGRKLSWFAPADGACGAWPLPLRASAAAPRATGGLILASEAGVAAFDTATGELSILEPVELETGFRSNDGKIDALGRFWWSVMDDEGGRRPGHVYCKAPGQPSRRVLGGIHIPNTLAVSADCATLYIADSKRQTLFAHAVEAACLELGEAREFAHTRGEDGTPDGSALDAEGFLWNAQWGAWRVVRYAPDGRIDRIVPMPVEQPTSCAFGGPDLDVLFVTSARDELSDEALTKQPLAGGLFALRPGVAGLPLPAFEG